MTKHTGKVIPASTFEYLLWNTLYTHVRAHTNTRSYNRDVFVLARERAFELRINASHRLGGLKGLRESLWTEPKIILRVHAAEWTGIRCLRCPGNEATPRLGFAHLFLSFFFFFFPSPLEPSAAQLAAAVKIYVDVLPSVISLFFSLLLSSIIFYTPSLRFISSRGIRQGGF